MMHIPLLVLGDVSGRFISGIEAQRGNVNVIRHIQDMGELLGIARSGIARAALIVTQSEELTLSTVTSLVEADVAVCVINDVDEQTRFNQVTYIDSLADISEVISSIQQAVDDLASGQGTEPEERTPGAGVPAAEVGADIPEGEDQSSQSPDNQPAESSTGKHGQTIVVWGPTGAPGRTTIAVNIAAAYAEKGYSVCLVDADTYGPAVSAVLGLTDEYSSLAQLCHHAERGQLTQNTVEELRTSISLSHGSLDVITGINRPDRWAEIRRHTFEQVIASLTAAYDIVVVDTGFCLEEDEALTFDGLAPQRNDATLAAIATGDHTVVIGQADIVGIPRLIKGYEHLKQQFEQLEETDITIAVNRVRSESVGPAARGALEHSWKRFGPNHPIDFFLSDDSTTVEKARLAGQTVFETDPNSTIAQEMKMLTDLVHRKLGIGRPEGKEDQAGSHTGKQRRNWFARKRKPS
ncbi:AAA family ATPase [Rothia nasimurium]|uniref:AAA family ATPase n=1 Tax=Rothia nasimurium TaxID=85336 RepID=UPI003BA3B321